MAVNRLAREKSPYLLQHAHNPVDWHPWGEEAFAKAREEDKPVFLSVGYATCHWCHVMAHESFEDGEVASVLNDLYVSIKVDREERPDVDQVYMAACQALTGQGGWPLSVFMTPDGKPFYAGTYFPKTNRLGRPGFIELIKMLAEKYSKERQIVLKAAEQLTQVVRGAEQQDDSGQELGESTLGLGFRQIAQRFDPRWGGFGPAPKFPTPHYYNFLLRWHHRKNDSQALTMVENSLGAMRQGGIFDHIGLGFHRYSVDERWLVPHFEKMLYDQALLALAYLETHQVTGGELYARTAREIFSYVLRDMTSPGGGFYAAEDADSDGEEGLFYVWRPAETESVLGPELGQLFNKIYDITLEGNFENGLSIPHLDRDPRESARDMGLDPETVVNDLARARELLYEYREKRNKPLKDDKVLTAWNGLMIAALARGAQVLGDGQYARAAARAVDFVLDNLTDGEGGLLRRYRDNQADFPGYLEDYAFMVWGLLELYETVFEVRYLEKALSLTRIMLDQFWDETAGGLYFTGAKNETLIARKKEIYDGAMPSGNSVALMNLLRLGRLTGETGLEDRADRIIKAFAQDVGQYPSAHTHFLMGLDWAMGPTREIVVVKGPDGGAGAEMVTAVHRTFLPRRVVMVKDTGDSQDLAGLAPLVRAMEPVDGVDTFFLCQGYACQTPLTEVSDVEAELSDQGWLSG